MVGECSGIKSSLMIEDDGSSIIDSLTVNSADDFDDEWREARGERRCCLLGSLIELQYSELRALKIK